MNQTATARPLLNKPNLDSADIRNYRPVSLLSILSQTLECAAYNHLSSYLSQNSFLDPNQSDFRTTHSTEMALLTVTESLQSARAPSSHSSVLIVLDLLHLTVNHQILLVTLAELCIADVKIILRYFKTGGRKSESAQSPNKILILYVSSIHRATHRSVTKCRCNDLGENMVFICLCRCVFTLNF